MKLIDEEDDVPGFPNFIHDGFDAFFKLTAVFCAGDHQGQVKRDNTAVTQKLRYITAGNFLSKSLDNGRLANTSLTNKHWIVFSAAA